MSPERWSSSGQWSPTESDGRRFETVLVVLTGLALAAGLYGRFKGLGTWPFGVDEYYIHRSIEFVRQSGVPAFPCGGFYVRGVLFQYLVAGLHLLSVEPELAARAVAATWGLLTLPAAYLIARRLHGVTAGLLVVLVLSLSLWEIEMSRFARMYAPFQSVFTWYVYFFLRFTVDRDRGAGIAMLALSVLGVLTWEGGVLLGAANFLPVLLRHRDGRLNAEAWRYVVVCVAVFGLIYVGILDWRLHGDVPAFGNGLPVEEPVDQGSDRGLMHRLLPALIPLAAAAVGFRWIVALRRRWIAALGLLVVLMAVVLSQLLLAAALLLLLVLVRLVTLSELRREGRWYVVGLGLAALLSIVTFVVGQVRAGAIGAREFAQAALTQFAGFPDVIAEIARPWAATVPWLTALIGLALIVQCWRALRRPDDPRLQDVAALLALVILLALMVGAAGPPRHETRYTFFLYPLLVTLAVSAAAFATSRLSRSASITGAAWAALVIGGFAVSGDFSATHIARVDSREVNFREGQSARLRSHFYPRSDFRAVANWLTLNAGPADIVINGVPPVAHYYEKTRYSFLDEQDDRYGAYACQRGTVDRWSDLPLLYPTDALDPLRVREGKLLIVLYKDRLERVLEAARREGWSAVVYWPTSQQDVPVLVLD